MKLSKLIVTVIISGMLFGCGQSTANNQNKVVKEYQDNVISLATEKGYTVEELSALKTGQEVKKDYDNAVLAKFGKVQGYLYEVTNKWNDGLMEGPFNDKTKEYSVLSLDDMKKTHKDSYEDSKHFSKYTIKLSKKIIFDLYYDASLEESYWKLDGELNNSGSCNNPLSEKDMETISGNAELKKQISQPYDDGGVQIGEGLQLKFPDVAKTEE